MQRVSHGEEEEDVLELGGESVNSISGRGAIPVNLVGNLCSEKPKNTYALIDVMIKAFKAKGNLTARDWGNGTLIFSFKLEEDRAMGFIVTAVAF
ncbi:hypothetical protein ACS0TY_033473 [Phlomoides rotata]